jgi:hypothetical protein
MKSEQIPNKFSKENCVFCSESKLDVGEKTEYGAMIIYKVGNSKEDGWFVILSPKTGGDPKKDFSVQLVPFDHLRNFSEINNFPKLAKNYGVVFSKLSAAAAKVIEDEDPNFASVPVGTYGKCKHPDEHIHIKIFPWRGDIGQPFTTDSSFQRKEVFKDETDKEFVKMSPVRKLPLSDERFNELSKKFISILEK